MWRRRIAPVIAMAMLAVLGMNVVSVPSRANGRGDPINGDLNGDGLADVAYLGTIQPDSCSVVVQYGSPTGPRPPVAYTWLRPGDGTDTICPDIGVAFDWDDAPGDELWVGWADEIPISLGYNRVILKEFRIAVTFTSPIVPDFLGVEDFTGDGRLTPYSYGRGGFATYIPNGGGTGMLGPERWCSADSPGVRLADFNRNRARDVLLTYTRGCTDSANGVLVVLDDGTIRQLQLDPTRRESWTANITYANDDSLADVRTTSVRTGDTDYFITTVTGSLVRAPRANGDSVTIQGGKRTLIKVLDNDYVTSEARVAIATPPRYGTVQLTSDREIVYTPNGPGDRTDKLVYTVTDAGRQSTTWVSIRLAD